MNTMKMGTSRVARLLLAFALLGPALSAWAQWELDSTKSAVNFISIKNDSVAEVHSFGELVGYVSAQGKVHLGIDLVSVETLIEIRNERMRELLFETVSFPSATVSAQVAPEIVGALNSGATLNTELNFTLALHGVEKSFASPVVLIGESDGGIQVFTSSPVIINAADFGLVPGIDALREVAGLNAISTAVPVTVHLVFNRAAGPN